MKLNQSQSTSWKLLALALIVGFFRIASFVRAPDVRAVQCKENPCENHQNPQGCLEKAIEQCKDNLIQTQQEKRSLQQAIQIKDGQIALQQVQINQTLYQINLLQTEIEELKQRIGGLNLSLDRLSSILVKRINQQYKRSKLNPLLLLFQGDSLNNFLADYKYLKLAKSQTLEAMQKAETQRQLYDQQKKLREEKQAELETVEQQLEEQRTQLNQQKQEKEQLLVVTKHQESRYQQLLAATKAEKQALAIEVAIEDGKKKITYTIGGLTKQGHVDEGTRIGVMGNTGYPGCSTGSHLHLEYINEGQLNEDQSTLKGITADPLLALKSTTTNWFNENNKLVIVNLGSGSWSWPLGSPIITQMYGVTPYSSRYQYGFHTGLDSVDLDDYTVKAIEGGTLYTGTLYCNSVSSLIKTAIVDHGEGKFSTYLHLNSY